MHPQTIPIGAGLVMVVVLMLTGPIAWADEPGRTIFRDCFENVDPSVWEAIYRDPAYEILHEGNVRFLRLHVMTFNAEKPGRLCRPADLATRARFGLDLLNADEMALEFATRMRFNRNSGGMNLAFWLGDYKNRAPHKAWNEIDIAYNTTQDSLAFTTHYDPFSPDGSPRFSNQRLYQPCKLSRGWNDFRIRRFRDLSVEFWCRSQDEPEWALWHIVKHPDPALPSGPMNLIIQSNVSSAKETALTGLLVKTREEDRSIQQTDVEFVHVTAIRKKPGEP